MVRVIDYFINILQYIHWPFLCTLYVRVFPIRAFDNIFALSLFNLFCSKIPMYLFSKPKMNLQLNAIIHILFKSPIFRTLRTSHRNHELKACATLSFPFFSPSTRVVWVHIHKSQRHLWSKALFLPACLPYPHEYMSYCMNMFSPLSIGLEREENIVFVHRKRRRE